MLFFDFFPNLYAYLVVQFFSRHGKQKFKKKIMPTFDFFGFEIDFFLQIISLFPTVFLFS